ncbi:hypothetical protein [Glaciecola sp. 1036]|uniref:hypothetical protein n=1 Tax=Alteromonadaceae TaxID=72275 RepID=UPI003D05EF18
MLFSIVFQPHSNSKFRRLLALGLIASFCSLVSGCISSAKVDRDGRISVSHFGVLHVYPNPEESSVIDLRDATLLGVYSDGSISLGYKNKKEHKIQLGCNALIITDDKTDHSQVVTTVNSIPFHKVCSVSADSDKEIENQFDKESQTVYLGVTKITQSLTFPPKSGLKAQEFSSWGMMVGDTSVLGHSRKSLISSGSECTVLILAQTRSEYEFYKQHLNFKDGENLCLALNPTS